jgi:hypothetical protein
MPKNTYQRKRKTVCEGVDIDVEDLSWEAIAGIGFPISMKEGRPKSCIKSERRKKLRGKNHRNRSIETNRKYIDKPEECQDIDIVDIVNVLIVLYGQEAALNLMAHLPKSLERLAKLRKQDKSEPMEIEKEDRQLLAALIISSSTKESKRHTVFERIGIVLHLIAIALSLWWR